MGAIFSGQQFDPIEGAVEDAVSVNSKQFHREPPFLAAGQGKLTAESICITIGKENEITNYYTILQPLFQ